MKKYDCTLCLGSNTDAQANVEKAHTALSSLLPDILWEEARWTTPINIQNPALFLNQKAGFSTAVPRDELILRFKEIERSCGRLPEEKAQGIIRMDIDLLTYGDEVVKEDILI